MLKRTSAFPAIRILLIILASVPGRIFASQYTLKPLVGTWGKPLDPGLVVTFESPSAWRLIEAVEDNGRDYRAILALSGHEDEHHPKFILGVTAFGLHDSTAQSNGSHDLTDPMHSAEELDLESAAPVKTKRKIETFRAGDLGKLPIWEFRSDAYDFLLILIVHQHTTVELSVRADDARELRKFIPDLKRIARSVRFVRS